MPPAGEDCAAHGHLACLLGSACWSLALQIKAGRGLSKGQGRNFQRGIPGREVCLEANDPASALGQWLSHFAAWRMPGRCCP